MTPEEIALDIYKTIQVSVHNDAYEEHQRNTFVAQVAPIIALKLREAVAEECAACANIADKWGKGKQLDIISKYDTTRRIRKATATIIAYTIRARMNTETT